MTLADTIKIPLHAGNGVMRVLHIRTAVGNGGGPEKTIFHGAQYLPDLAVHAEALYLLNAHLSSDALLERAERSQMPVHTVAERSAMDPTGPSALARLVRRGRFDIIHAHDYKSNTLARLVAPAGNYRIVATAHGYNQTTWREGCYYALERLLLRRADAVICPSPDLADQLASSGVSRRRLHVIPNGIILNDWPFQARRQRPGAPLGVLFVGRLSLEKNVAGLLGACGALVRQGRPVRLRVAGEGPQRESLARHARKLNLHEAVEWLGFRRDVGELLAQTAIFVNPSYTEAMPNTVLEAMAGGAPVVATDVGATRELVLHEQTGLLVPPGDTNALVAAIARLGGAADFAQQLAVRARGHVEQNFDLATRVAHVVAVYRGVLATARR